MREIDLLREAKRKTLSRIIDSTDVAHVGKDLKDIKISIWDVKEILYDTMREIAKREFEEKF